MFRSSLGDEHAMRHDTQFNFCFVLYSIWVHLKWFAEDSSICMCVNWSTMHNAHIKINNENDTKLMEKEVNNGPVADSLN